MGRVKQAARTREQEAIVEASIVEMVYLWRHQAVTDSLMVARFFEMRHDNVVRVIERRLQAGINLPKIGEIGATAGGGSNLLKIEEIAEAEGTTPNLLKIEEPDVDPPAVSLPKVGEPDSAEPTASPRKRTRPGRELDSMCRQEIAAFTRLNFARGHYVDDMGRKQPMYHMTRLGFDVTAMSFTGLVADVWKIRYATAFERMAAIEEQRQSADHRHARELGKEARREFTDAVQLQTAYNKGQGSRNTQWLYVNYSKSIQRELFVINDILPEPRRDYLSPRQIMSLATIESVAARVILQAMEEQTPYRAIYSMVQDRARAFAAVVGRTEVLQRPDRTALDGTQLSRLGGGAL